MDIPAFVIDFLARAFFWLLRRFPSKPKCKVHVFREDVRRFRAVLVNGGRFPVLVMRARILRYDGFHDVLGHSVRLAPGESHDIIFEAGPDDVSDDDLILSVVKA